MEINKIMVVAVVKETPRVYKAPGTGTGVTNRNTDLYSLLSKVTINGIAYMERILSQDILMGTILYQLRLVLN